MDNNANPLSPGGTAAQSEDASDIDTSPTQMLFTHDTTAAAGSHTASCSMTGSSRPLIGTLSFGTPAVTPPNVLRKKGWIGE
jgi:hypothetical protein